MVWCGMVWCGVVWCGCGVELATHVILISAAVAATTRDVNGRTAGHVLLTSRLGGQGGFLHTLCTYVCIYART